MGKQINFNTNMTKQSNIRAEYLPVLRFSEQIPVLAEVGRPFREIYYLSCCLMFLSCTLLLQNRLSHTNNQI